MQLDNVVDEILLNATFCNINKVPESFVKVILEDLNRNFAKYLEYEERNAELVDLLMEKSTLQMNVDAKVNFLGPLY